MKFFAKIIHEQELINNEFWKYTFLDAETNQKDYFYNSERIGYDPNLTGKLSISSNKFFQSFKKEVGEIIKKAQKTETLIGIKGEAGKIIEKVFDKLSQKQIKLSLDPQKLHELHAQGYTWKEVGLIYGKSEPTIYRWIRPNIKPLQKRGRKPIITEKLISLLRSYVPKNNTKTQQEITDYVCKELDTKISRPSITVLLKKIGITRKKLTYHYTQLNEEKARIFNEETKPLLANYPFLALDECSFYPNLDPRFGYSFKGLRAVNKRPSSQGKHYTLLFAIGSVKEKGVINWKLIESGADWKIFYDFLEEINPIGEKKNYLLMDNARIHHAFKKRAKEELPNVKEQMLKKNIEVRYIVPYAPMLNPAELAFCLLRQQTEKNRPRNYEEMKSAIEKVVELLNKKNLSEYFRHCVEYFDQKRC